MACSMEMVVWNTQMETYFRVHTKMGLNKAKGRIYGILDKLTTENGALMKYTGWADQYVKIKHMTVCSKMENWSKKLKLANINTTKTSQILKLII